MIRRPDIRSIDAMFRADSIALTRKQAGAVRLLDTLRRMGEPMTVVELGEAMGMPDGVGVLVTALAQKGYVRHPGAEGGPIVLLRNQDSCVADPSVN